MFMGVKCMEISFNSPLFSEGAAVTRNIPSRYINNSLKALKTGWEPRTKKHGKT